jgi:hypothetical protein
MPEPLLNPIGSIAIVAALLLLGAVDLRGSVARADDCLTAPGSPAPDGSHWYYHLDSTKKRKCWYLRAADQPVQPASAQIPSPPHNIATAPNDQKSTDNGVGVPLPHIKMLAVTPQPAPAPAPAETTDQPVERNAQEGNAASSTPAASPPQASTSMEASAQAAGPPPAVRPDPPAVGMVKSHEPTVALSRMDPDQATVDARASNNSDTSAQTSITNAVGMAASPMTPTQWFSILALVLVVAGFLFRVMMKITAARRRRITIDCPESYRIDDQHQRGWRDNQKYYAAIAEQDVLIDDLNCSLIPSASNYRPHRPFQTSHRWSEKTVGKDRTSAANDENSERKDTLEQLCKDLDRMLRSPRVA